MTPTRSRAQLTQPLSPIEFHVLLVLAGGDLYGYAILKSVKRESGGSVQPKIGSLYRVLARLMEAGLVKETAPPATAPEASPGLSRRYYHLTPRGRAILKADSERLRGALDLARARNLLPEAAR